MKMYKYAEYKQLVDSFLSSCFNNTPSSVCGLKDAMSYSLNIGGKRIRPVMVLEFSRISGGDICKTIPVACAVEFVHTYSLIHDDLPCMDNDDFRRGQPTNHKVYGETTSVIAADALQAEAYTLIMSSGLDAVSKVDAASVLSNASGLYGMCGGQFLDTVLLDYARTEETLNNVNILKTGALLRAACEIGVICGNSEPKFRNAARLFGDNIGLAFQIRDDVLDVIGTREQLGKDIGSDNSQNKITYMSLLGEDKCMKIVKELTEQAKDTLSSVTEDTDFLFSLADSLIFRTN